MGMRLCDAPMDKFPKRRTELFGKPGWTTSICGTIPSVRTESFGTTRRDVTRGSL